MKPLIVVLFVLSSVLVLAVPILRAQASVSGATVPAGNTDSTFLVNLAESGNAQAQSLLGEMHLTGKGVPMDYSEALKWFRAAAEQGDAEALRRLGYMYESGLGVERNPASAAKWYDRAMQRGDFFSLYKVVFRFLEDANIP